MGGVADTPTRDPTVERSGRPDEVVAAPRDHLPRGACPAAPVTNPHPPLTGGPVSSPVSGRTVSEPPDLSPVTSRTSPSVSHATPTVVLVNPPSS